MWALIIRKRIAGVGYRVVEMKQLIKKANATD